VDFLFSLKPRALAASLGVVSVVALCGISAGTANAVDIASGTGSLTVNASYLARLAESAVIPVPNGAQSYTINVSAKTVTAVFAATGGDADVNNFAGTVDYSGGFTFLNVVNGKFVKLSGLAFDLFNDQVDATETNGTVVDLFDTTGARSATVNADATQTFTASDLAVSDDGATFLNSALGTTVFHAGDQVGAFTTTFGA
jgi:hypothetical protein